VGCVSGWVSWVDVSMASFALIVVRAATLTTEINRLWSQLYVAQLDAKKPVAPHSIPPL
jgi:hypothetical protein